MSEEKLQAKGEHILIEVISRISVMQKGLSKSMPGFELQESKMKQGQPNQGTIYSIGDGCPKDLDYKVGDTVIFEVAKVEGIEWNGHKLFPAHWKSPKAIIKEI